MLPHTSECGGAVFKYILFLRVGLGVVLQIKKKITGYLSGLS